MPSNSAHKAIFYRDFANSYIPQILEEVYIKQVYKPYVLGRKDLVVVDIGANIGLTAQYFSDYAKRVIAVEPSKQHQETIETLITFNDIKNIEIAPYAISGENGEMKFYHPENVTMFSMENVMGATDYEMVKTITMDKFMDLYKLEYIDILKLDCEGSESRVICSEGFKKVAPKIKAILGEWHSWDSQSKDGFMNSMRDLGYEFKWDRTTHASCFTAVRL